MHYMRNRMKELYRTSKQVEFSFRKQNKHIRPRKNALSGVFPLADFYAAGSAEDSAGAASSGTGMPSFCSIVL